MLTLTNGPPARGEFREDLYYRISEVTIRIPPLRERPGDAVLIGQATMERLDTLCGTRYDHAPMISKRLKHDDAVDAAREALRRYMDASLVLFAADMKAKGFSGGIEEMEHIFGPVREMLNPVNDVSYSRTFHR